MAGSGAAGMTEFLLVGALKVVPFGPAPIK